MQNTRGWLAICALCLLTACSQREGKLTEVVVTIDAEESVAANLTRVEIATYDPEVVNTGAEVAPITSGTLTLHASKPARGTADFPFSVGVTKAKAERFLLVVKGYAGDEPVIEQKARVAFVDGEVRGLGVYLGSPCYKQLCGGVESSDWLTRTCNAASGACGAVDARETQKVAIGAELDAGLVMITAATVEPDAAPDSGPEVLPDSGHDLPDAASDPVVAPLAKDYALGVAGQTCAESQNQTLACEGHASRKVLKCNRGIWELFETCPEASRCDSRVGAGQGTCLSIPVPCVGKAAGDVCDGETKKTCGVDLVSLSDSACQANAHCDDTGEAKCVCDAGYDAMEQGVCSNHNDCPTNRCTGSNGTCQDGVNAYSCNCNPGFSGPDCETDACGPNPCQHGGVCSRAAQGASCDCGTSGYTGERCETDINECAATNLCTSTGYPCVQTAAPGYVCQGQFADWPMPDALPGSAFAPSYDTTTPGIVVDKVTGLIWQRTVDAGSYTWLDAKSYCDDLALAARSDWRLPTQIELQSIIDETKYGLVIDSVAFPDTPADNFWTASRYVDSPNQAWAVPFYNGIPPSLNTSLSYRVRCVRSSILGAGSPANRYVVDTTLGTVTDIRTGLTWRRTIQKGSFRWDAAKSQCTGGFRLPALKELLTIVDTARTNPCIDPAFRGETGSQDTPTEYFWSASPYVDSSNGFAWGATFYNGFPYGGDPSMPYRVRCVRSTMGSFDQQ